MKKQLPKILVIVGPTATGKSDLAVDMARRFSGEVVSADSRQVYRGFDIGSGKITSREMKRVPHHLLDVADPKQTYTVEKYKTDAAKAIAGIIARKKLPVIAGGTGFYIDALVFGEQFPEVPPDPALRTRLAKKSAAALMKEIAKLDPKRAKTLDPHNKVRIIRAIEIARVLGKVPKVKRAPMYDPLFIGLALDKEKLREKIHTRIQKRMKKGAMAREVSQLHKKGLSWKRLHDFGLEYRYLALYLQKKMGKEEMLAKLEQEIVWYAKRQMQWFKRNKKIRWFAPGENIKIRKEVKKFIGRKR
jgi:tRNA dimethylallyltransferase